MKTIWFSGQYKSPILQGIKTSTVRRVAGRPKLQEGEEIYASIGPRSPFARLRIEKIFLRKIEDFPPSKVSEIAAIYPGERQFREIYFKILEEIKV